MPPSATKEHCPFWAFEPGYFAHPQAIHRSGIIKDGHGSHIRVRLDTAAENLVAGTTPQSYAVNMDLIRRMLLGLIITLSGALASASVAMVASDLSHNAHCLNEIHASVWDVGAEPGLDHAQHAPSHTALGHDHETCTPHSCPALSPESDVLGEATDLVLISLSAFEIRLRVLSVQHDLNRPPRT